MTALQQVFEKHAHRVDLFFNRPLDAVILRAPKDLLFARPRTRALSMDMRLSILY